MISETQFRDLVSGRQRGITASLLRCGLGMLEVPYFAAVSIRNLLYDYHLTKTYQFPIPIVSVGNLTLGGTGKSPMVAWLAHLFLEQGLRPGLISRGYGSSVKNSTEHNDEYLELALRLPDVPHKQNRNRVSATEEFLAENSVDILILDDAFQHRRIGRSLDIVLLDATEPFGFDHIFPRGTLREPLAGLHRADMVLLSRADLVNEEERQRIKKRVPNICGQIAHVPESVISFPHQTSSLETIAGKTALAFCGIGNPAAFRQTLEECQIHVAELIPFPDHHRYTSHDLDRLEAATKRLGVEAIFCTMKDFVKLDRPEIAGIPIQAVSIGIRFLSDDDERNVRHLINQSSIYQSRAQK